MSSLYPEFFHEHFQDLSELLGEKDVLDRVLAIIGNVGAQFQIGASAGKSMSLSHLFLVCFMHFIYCSL